MVLLFETEVHTKSLAHSSLPMHFAPQSFVSAGGRLGWPLITPTEQLQQQLLPVENKSVYALPGCEQRKRMAQQVM